VYDLIRI